MKYNSQTISEISFASREVFRACSSLNVVVFGPNIKLAAVTEGNVSAGWKSKNTTFFRSIS